MANHKPPADRFDIQIKVYINDHLQDILRQLTSGARGVSEYFRDLICFADQRRRGKLLAVPVAGMLPAWVDIYNPVTKKVVHQNTTDNLVAFPRQSIEDMNEMVNHYERSWRMATEESSKLRWVVNQFLGGNDKAGEFLSRLPNGFYPLRISITQLDAEGVARVVRLSESECDPFAEAKRWKDRATRLSQIVEKGGLSPR